MSDEITGQGGQAPVAPEPQGNPEPISTPSEPAAGTQKSEPGESFTDFNSLPEDVRAQLEPYYKQMQGDYTRKTQKLSKAQKEHLQKVQAYDSFMQNPLDNIMRMGQQYGLQFAPAGGNKPQEQKNEPLVPEDWTPNTWTDVFGKSAEYLKPQVEQVIQQAISPYQEKIAALEAELGIQKAGRIEQQFNQIDPNWRQYEDEMRDLLNEHPSLARDPVKLYKLAVPEDVFKARATQDAIRALEAKTAAAKIESSGRSKPASPARDNKPVTFDQAFQNAKKQLGLT